MDMRKNGPVGWEDNRLLTMNEWLEEGRELDLHRSDYEYLATFINPVTRRLFDAVGLGTSIYIICPESTDSGAPDAIEMGHANYDRYDERDDYVRSHSPGGVVEHGVGYGLLVYSGLAMLAADGGHEGIFSTSNRSADAEEFWSSQVERDYATEQCLAGESGQRYVEVPVDEDYVREEIEQGLEETCGDLDVEVEGYVEVSADYHASTEAQTLTIDAVMESGFVLGWNDEKFYGNIVEDWKAPPLEVLYDLRLDNCFNNDTIYLLVKNIRQQAGDDLDKKKLMEMLSTAPDRFFEDDKFRRWYMELAGQQTFDFDKLQEDREQMQKNPRSSAWEEFYGELAKAAP